MNNFAITLCAGIMTTVVVGTPLRPTPAEAARTPSPEAAALKEATATCKAEAKEKLAREPKICEQLRRQDCQTHGGPTSGDCRKTGNRCMQGRGEGQEDQVAREPEIRQHLSLKRSQGLSP
jgi:hypothetical protein